jgi:hypothetical protein
MYEVDSKKSQVQAAGLGLVEKANEPRWALQLLIAALYADLVLLWQAGHGLLQWSARTDELLQNLGLVAVGVVGFALLAGIVLPLWADVCRRVVVWLAIQVPGFRWLQEARRDRLPGSISPYTLKTEAIARESTFMWSRWKEHDEATKKQHADQLRLGVLVVGVLTLGSVDWAAQWIFPGGVSLLAAAERALPSPAFSSTLLAAATLSSLAVLRWAWFSGWNTDWLHYPPLAPQPPQEPAFRRAAARGNRQ